MEDRSATEIYDNGPSCSARAASLRQLADELTLPDMKARLLELAKTWDERAAVYAGLHS